ncbi:MAG: ParB/RepB/Spo0J family partition protein [bacterium]|nr:ParB/RepB/Spo0J family partition protein [bacterium]
MAKRNALGKGLGALIPGAEETDAADSPSEDTSNSSEQPGLRVIEIAIDDIEPNPHQPRTEFDLDAVNELADSIREKGIIQPLTVRRFGSGYQLIAGERRLRAAGQAGLESVPCIVHQINTDQGMMEISLIENIQREDLNPIEEARAYRALMEECYLTQEEVAQKVGKERSTVANTLRLLNLSVDVRDALQADQISMGHARALLALEDDRAQAALCRKIIHDGLSVRTVEALVKAYKEDQTSNGGKPKPRPKDPQILSLEEDLQHRFGTSVSISRKGKKGKIEIEFYTDDDLERLLDLLQATSL